MILKCILKLKNGYCNLNYQHLISKHFSISKYLNYETIPDRSLAYPDTSNIPIQFLLSDSVDTILD